MSIRAELIDSMGSDLSVVRAAKVSFADDTTVQRFIDDIEAEKLGCRSHSALLRYLAKHSHWTPYGHTAITFRCSAPVPIRTQCFKHKQGFVENEESRRYISSKPEVYYPEVWRKAPEGSVKQGSSDEAVLVFERPAYGFTSPSNEYQWVVREALNLYQDMIAGGICPEQARLVLPQGCLVNWYWTGSLAAYARFYRQRTDPHAQLEIQTLARMIGDELAKLYPVSWTALTT